MKKLVNLKKNIATLAVVAVMIISGTMTTAADGAVAGGSANRLGYIVVSDYIQAQSPKEGENVADVIQKLIDTNPNRTLFFPDGEYILTHPIYTPADPRKSVSLRLSEFAVLKAAKFEAANSTDDKDTSTASGGWKGDWAGQAVVQLGGICPANDTHTNGSNYSMEGGIVDGSGFANGVSINSGRETAVRNVSIKQTVIGLHIKHGANGGSSDSDISGLNIIGCGTKDSTGILLEGFDNSLTNIRIGNVFTGVYLKSAGNVLRNIHPLYYSGFDEKSGYPDSCGFVSEGWDNWFDFCYSDQFSIGFRTIGDGAACFNDCFCFWYAPKGGTQTAFKAEKKFNSIVTNLKIGFNHTDKEKMKHVVLSVGEAGGKGTMDNLSVNESLCTDGTYKAYLDGKARNKQ